MSNGQLQTSVNRSYAQAVAGQIVREGPTRGRVARIASATIGTDPAASTNRMSRAFGYTADISEEGTTLAALVDSVSVGGATFLGILGHPQRYALYGQAGNSLAPSVDLPQGAEGEFYDMVTGLMVELFNEQTAAKTMNFGDQLAYCPAAIPTADNPQVIPYGGLISVAAGAAVPTGFILIPNARIINTSSLTASAAGAPVSGLSIVQLTQ